jgi:hypothetical protein
MSFDQGEFDFDAPGDGAGYRNWRRHLDEQKRALESRWGIILGHRVVLTLHAHDRPLEGIIRIIPNRRADGVRPLRLQIGRLEFTPAEIASIVRLDPMPT